MKIIAILFLSLFCLTAVTYSQKKTVSSNGANYEPTNNKASVYITFEKLGGKQPMVKSNEYNSQRISLRLHNNMISPIAVEANYDAREVSEFPVTLFDGGRGFALPDSAEIEVCYEVEAMPQINAEEFNNIRVPRQIPSHYGCKWTAKRRGRGNIWILPGKSIIFSVPREFLAKDLKLYTTFNYEWESDKGQMKADEPVHHAYFYASDLPNNLQKQ